MAVKRDFRSGLNKNTNKAKIDEEMEKLSPEQKKQFNRAQMEMDKYKGKSKDELMRELKTVVAQGKSKGTINDEMIENMRSKVGPMLNSEQKRNLDSIVNMLKGK